MSTLFRKNFYFCFLLRFLRHASATATAADAEKPDLVIQNLLDMIPWLDQINPDMHIDEAQQSSGMFVPFF